MPSKRPAAQPPKGSRLPLTNLAMFHRLWAYLRPHRLLLFTGMSCGIIAGLLPLGIGELISKFISTLTPGKMGLMGPHRRVELIVVCCSVVVTYVVLGIFRYGQSVFLALVTQRVGLSMRSDVFSHLQRLSLAYFHRRRTGELMSAMTNDVSKMQDAAMRIRDVVATPITVIACLARMFYLDWRLTGFSLLVLPAMGWAIGKLTRSLRGISDESQQRTADVNAVMEETLAAPRIVRAFSAEAREITRFEDSNRTAMRVQMRSIRRNARLGPVVDLIGATGLALTLWVGGTQILNHGQTVATLGQIVFLMSQVAPAVGSFGGLLGGWEEMMGAADRLFREVLDVQPDIQDVPGALTLPPVQGRITFDAVGFAYLPGTPTLQDINLTIEPGQVVALVGQTGAGKSTLADLVPRFYDPTEGSVRVDGYDLRTVTIASLRKQIGIVPQETLLFSGTIRSNIAYGRPDATDAQVEAAARAANADSFIQGLPEKYETRIGQRGQTLSGGERQRIAIARALLADPRILILDEATSSLDASTEALVQEALDVLMRGRTTIVIAHRLSTIVNADRIVVMRKGGRIAETGTHSELMKLHGVYAALYESQQRAAELTATES